MDIIYLEYLENLAGRSLQHNSQFSNILYYYCLERATLEDIRNCFEYINIINSKDLITNKICLSYEIEKTLTNFELFRSSITFFLGFSSKPDNLVVYNPLVSTNTIYEQLITILQFALDTGADFRIIANSFITPEDILKKFKDHSYLSTYLAKQEIDRLKDFNLSFVKKIKEVKINNV